ncbi:DUF6316 family protein [Pleionea sediminis]|uniref:DUF6316 family protein n=1 Tax=Pleionea sediminis TaxID=2569479 RepID=UPI0011863825|nr:DUF6316 family protein [Pleionea sediminis]
MRTEDLDYKQFERSSRYIQEGKHWYFKTREGDFLGPYESVHSMLEAEQIYIALMKQHSKVA